MFKNNKVRTLRSKSLMAMSVPDIVSYSNDERSADVSLLSCHSNLIRRVRALSIKLARWQYCLVLVFASLVHDLDFGEEHQLVKIARVAHMP